jgi:hypothetical protein
VAKRLQEMCFPGLRGTPNVQRRFWSPYLFDEQLIGIGDEKIFKLGIIIQADAKR